MNLVSGIVVFCVVWWLVFFTMLPLGVVSQYESGDEIEDGTDPGAPQKPMLWKKAGLTTLVTCVLFAIIFATIESGIISLDRGGWEEPLQ